MTADPNDPNTWSLPEGMDPKHLPDRMTEKPGEAVRKMLQAEFPDYDPLLELARIAMDSKTPDRVKLRCHTELATYCYPKLKSAVVTGPDGGNVGFDLRFDLANQLVELLDRVAGRKPGGVEISGRVVGNGAGEADHPTG